LASVSIRIARQKMSTLIEEVQHGGTVTITKRGREVARIVPIRATQAGGALPDLSGFRKSIRSHGKGLAEEVRAMRHAERA